MHQFHAPVRTPGMIFVYTQMHELFKRSWIAGESLCKEASTALQACEANFDLKVQAFDAVATTFEAKIDGMRSETHDTMEQYKQQYEQEVGILQ